MHMKRDLLDALTPALTLRTDQQSVRPIHEIAGVEGDVGRQLPINDRLRIVIQVHTNARFVHDGTPVSAIVAQDGLLRVVPVSFARANQHPDHNLVFYQIIVAMLVPVWGGSANVLLTMRGRLRDLVHSYPLMFVFVGVIGYLAGSTQGTVEAFRS
jgi:hypothetical protein